MTETHTDRQTFWAAIMNNSACLVTYRRRKSGRTHQIRFYCDAENTRLILMEAWNTDSSIVAVELLTA